mgnify:CR=1 FL=1
MEQLNYVSMLNVSAAIIVTIETSIDNKQGGGGVKCHQASAAIVVEVQKIIITTTTAAVHLTHFLKKMKIIMMK